jgi:hypothetical protein
MTLQTGGEQPVEHVGAALDEAIRALRDIAALDPNRQVTNNEVSHAQKALERISYLLNEKVDAHGRTIQAGERRTYPPLHVGVYDV